MGKFEKVNVSQLLPGVCFRRPGLSHTYTVLGPSRVGPGTNVEQYVYLRLLITLPDGTLDCNDLVPFPRWKPVMLRRLA